MGDTIQLVDSIDSSPTVRLDLNDESTWSCRQFEAPPPRLRRAVSANAMRDGLHVSSSQYEARTVRLELELLTSTQDANATQLQTLFRELDRENGLLKYQPTGASKPVFFRLYRSDASAVTDVTVQTAMRILEVELLAEPFALGLKESVGPLTLDNDPAAGSNGIYVDVTGVIGDVATPALVQNTSRWATSGFLCARQHGTPSDLVFFKQCESFTLGTNTSNPGGGPDSAMSGSGTNNYVRTSFGTASLVERLSWDLSTDINTVAEQVAARGDFRVVAVVRQNGATSTLTARASLDFGAGTQVDGEIKTLSGNQNRHLLDLGVFSLCGAPRRLPNQLEDIGASSLPTLKLSAGRDAGSDTLDWDCVYLLPADEQFMFWHISETASTSLDALIDGYQDRIYVISGSDPFASTSTVGAERNPPNVTGGFPRLVPDQTNRIFGTFGGSLFGAPVTETNSLTFHYWPRYLYVRPSSS